MPSFDMSDMPEEVKDAIKQVLVRSMGKSSDSEFHSKVPVDAQLIRLSEVAQMYDENFASPVFKRGDIVTPMKQYGIKGSGNPHVVLELLPNAEPMFIADKMSSPLNGGRSNMRIATFVDEEILCYWVEAFQYQPWTE